jgi:hypothetical protein
MELEKGARQREQLTTMGRCWARHHGTRRPVAAAASPRAVRLLHDDGLGHGLGSPEALLAALGLAGAHTLVPSQRRPCQGIVG